MKLLINLPITAKLAILVGVTLLGLSIAGLYSAYMMQREMVSARVSQTRALVDTARNMAIGLAEAGRGRADDEGRRDRGISPAAPRP